MLAAVQAYYEFNGLRGLYQSVPDLFALLLPEGGLCVSHTRARCFG